MNNGRPGTRQEIPLYPSAFYESSYSTLAVSFIVLLGTGALFIFFFHQAFAHPNRVPLWILAGAWCLLASFASQQFSNGYFQFVQRRWTLSPRVRHVLLGWFGGSLLVTVALATAATGGTTSSPLSHYLTAISGLAIVFASQERTRWLMTGVAMIAFWISGKYYIQICPVGTEKQLPAMCNDPVAQSDELLLFNTFCVAVVAAMAVFAVAKQQPEVPTSTHDATTGSPQTPKASEPQLPLKTD